jgi:hypothetical protein
MKIFQTERNSDCPCGSGRKFKKCCQERVGEATRRISQTVGMESITAEGLDVIETLGFLCGLRAEDGHMPSPETLGRLLNEAWDEVEQISEIEDEGALSALSLRVQVLLGEKHKLRAIRVPVWQFEFEKDDNTGDNELFHEIVDYLGGPLGRIFIIEAVDSIGMSLLYDDYSDEDIKTLLIALGWLVIDDTRNFFLYTVLHKTAADLAAAEEELDKIRDKYEDANNEELYQELRSLLRRYPVYDQMLSENMKGDIKKTLSAVAGGKLKIETPLYSVLGGISAMLSKLIDMLDTVAAQRRLTAENLPLLEETLFAEGEFRFFFPELTNCLDKAAKESEDSELRDCVNNSLFFLILLSDRKQVAVVKLLYVYCICSFISKLPVAVPGSDIEFRVLGDFYDQPLIERYACHLEFLEMFEEAEHVRDVFRKMGEEEKRKIDLHEDELIELTGSILDKA